MWNSGSAMDYVFRKWFFIWKILIWFENVIRVYCCTRLAQLSTTFVFKIPIFVKSRIGDGLCVLKMIFHLENINLIGKCYRGLLLYSPTTAQLLWNPGSLMDYVFWKWVSIWKILIWLESFIRIYCCTRLPQLSTTICFSKFLFLWNPGSVMDYVFSFGKY